MFPIFLSFTTTIVVISSGAFAVEKPLSSINGDLADECKIAVYNIEKNWGDRGNFITGSQPPDVMDDIRFLEFCYKHKFLNNTK